MTNQLFYGDNLEILRRNLRDETVDLCYIDPPFNSKRNYFQIYNNIGKDDLAQAQAFIDTWTWNELSINGYQEIITNDSGRYTQQTIELIKGLHAVLGNSGLLAYLISITQRVNEIQRVLKPTGSFYLHCDPTASHYLKLILDSVFCPRGGDFLNELVWKRMTASGFKGKINIGQSHDVIFRYAKSKEIIFNSIVVPYSENYITQRFNKVDENGRRFKDEKIGTATSEATIEKLKKEGRIYTTSTGKLRIKHYIEDVAGIRLDDVWTDISPINSQATERLGYPTQKPEALLERIIQASSNENDVVLDAYCGCGTTVAVAQRLKRNWIGIDITYQSIAVILKRLEDSFGAEIVNAIQMTGIPKDMAAAQQLANKKDDRLRKEFEKWAVLTYSRNRAIINDKKGADKGVDGIAYMVTGIDTTARIIFQVKSGGVKRNDIATLNSDRQREQAELAILLTLQEPTKPMRDEALAAGIYHHALVGRDFPRIQIVTIQEMIENGQRLDLPMGVDVLKTAKAADNTEQQILEIE